MFSTSLLANNVLSNARSLLSSVGSGSFGDVEEKLNEAISQLEGNEKQRLQDITEELLRRSIARANERLSSVPRLI